jgi:hypothetical protein
MEELMKRNWRDIIVTRSWVATIKYKGDPAGYRTLTTTIHGPNPSEAELAYMREHPDVAAVIIRHASRS